MQNQNQSQLGRARVRAFGTDHVYLLRAALIGSLRRLRMMWLAIVIALVLVLRHSGIISGIIKYEAYINFSCQLPDTCQDPSTWSQAGFVEDIPPQRTTLCYELCASFGMATAALQKCRLMSDIVMDSMCTSYNRQHLEWKPDTAQVGSLSHRPVFFVYRHQALVWTGYTCCIPLGERALFRNFRWSWAVRPDPISDLGIYIYISLFFMRRRKSPMKKYALIQGYLKNTIPNFKAEGKTIPKFRPQG